MKSVIHTIAALLLICCLFYLPALILGVALGWFESEDFLGFQVCFWGFLIFFIIHLILGGKAQDFKFWARNTKS
jgi:hypothetical protein